MKHIGRCVLLDEHWGSRKDLACKWASVCFWITQGRTELWTPLRLLLTTSKVLLEMCGFARFGELHFYFIFCAYWASLWSLIGYQNLRDYSDYHSLKYFGRYFMKVLLINSTGYYLDFMKVIDNSSFGSIVLNLNPYRIFMHRICTM